MTPSGRVVIVGAGMVGSSAAYSILNQDIAKEILIIDIANELVNAHVLDLEDASNFTQTTKVAVANYSDIKDGDIVAITAGIAQKEGQTRLDLLKINADITRDIIEKINLTSKDVYILLVSNPVDILTFVAQKKSNMDSKYVFGSGTLLDTVRLRSIISKEIGVNSQQINAFIMGEHGDTSFPVISNADVSGIKLSKLMKITDDYSKSIMEQVRNKAYEIILGKKATYFGIGADIAYICRTIIRNEKRILPLSTMLNGEYGIKNICIGAPVLLSSQGVSSIGEIELNDSEKTLFTESAKAIELAINSLNLN